MGTEAQKAQERIANLLTGVVHYLKEEGAAHSAVNEPVEQVTWPELEEALDFHEFERPSILAMSDRKGVELVTSTNGIYLGVPGEKAKSLLWQYRQGKSRLRTISGRIGRITARGDIDKVAEFARVNGMTLAEIPRLCDVAGHPLPADAIAMLAAPSE